MKKQTRSIRTFSATFKQDKVKLLDSGKISVLELSKIYDVSIASIYKWKKKYSALQPGERIVVEKISEEKKNIELLKQIRELEQIIGKKQIELDYYKSAIEILSEQQGEDLLKKFTLK